MLARDSTRGCFSGTSKSQGSFGAWGSFDARQLLALSRQRFLDMRLIVQDHESIGLVTTYLLSEHFDIIFTFLGKISQPVDVRFLSTFCCVVLLMYMFLISISYIAGVAPIG